MTKDEIKELARCLAAELKLPTETSPYLTVNEVATLLKLSVPTVERLTRSGEIPSRKFGRCRRYLRSELLSMNRGADRERPPSTEA